MKKFVKLICFFSILLVFITSQSYAENTEVKIIQISVSNSSLRIDWSPIENITGYNVIYKDSNKNIINKNYVSRDRCFDSLMNYKDVRYIDILGVLEGGKTVQTSTKVEIYNNVPLNINPVILGASIIDDKTKVVINPDIDLSSISKISIIHNDEEYDVNLNNGLIDKKLSGTNMLLCKVTLKNSRVIYGKTTVVIDDVNSMVRAQTECKLLGRKRYEGGYVQYIVHDIDSFVVQTYTNNHSMSLDFLLNKENDFTFELPTDVNYVEFVNIDDGPVFIDDLSQPFDKQLALHKSQHPFKDYEFYFKASHAQEETTNQPYILPRLKINSHTLIDIVVNGNVMYHNISVAGIEYVKIPVPAGTNNISYIAHNLDGKTDSFSFVVKRKKVEVLTSLDFNKQQNVSDSINGSTDNNENNTNVDKNHSSPTTGNNLTNNDITLTFAKNYDNITVTNPTIYISGHVTGASALLINDVDIDMSIYGDFGIQASLKEGNNKIVVKALNDTGTQYTKEINIIYEVPNLIINVNELEEIEREYKKIPENEEEIEDVEDEYLPSYNEVLANESNDSEVFIYVSLITAGALLLIIFINNKKRRRKYEENTK